MINKHLKFPKIGQLRSVIKNVREKTAFVRLDELNNPVMDYNRKPPVLHFVGLPKLHGTNAGIIQRLDNPIQVQSRNRILTEGSDNQGFFDFVSNRTGFEYWEDFFSGIRSNIPGAKKATIGIYGEWAGQGIQSGVAISGLKKAFYIFAIRLGEEEDTSWLTPDQMRMIPSQMFDSTKNVRSILDFECWELDIDFSNPGLNHNTLVQLTEEVEEECPVGKKLGVKGTGEGIVWRCVSPGYQESSFWFKVKGEKHSSSKVKTLAPIDIEKVKSIDEFNESVLTQARLMQGIEYLKEMEYELSQKSTGQYLKWIFNDVLKEEGDRLEASSLSSGDVSKPLSTKARVWFFNWLDNFQGL